jgi:hypothetical protein
VGVDKVIVFTGAGMSVPLGLPTTTDFLSDLRQGQAQVTASVCSYLDSVGSSRGQDIEWILSELERFSNGAGFIEENLQAFANGNSNASAGLPHMKNVITAWRKHAKNELTRIKKILYKKLQSFDVEVACELYENLIRQLKVVHPEASFSVITTNYDLTFDTFIEEADLGKLYTKNFNTSFRGNIYDPSEAFRWEMDSIEYLKIHGSLDWHPGRRGCSRSGVATTPENPDEMHILYPGFKGAPESEPFISLSGKLARRLNEATHAYVIGFAFRDAHINAMFENAMALRKDLAVTHVNPSPIDEYPAESAVRRFNSSFENFKIVQNSVSVSEEPLPI